MNRAEISALVERAIDRLVEREPQLLDLDITEHKRNSDEANLLVLELKKPGEDRAYDNLKLRAFRAELGYQHTAHVILGRGSNGDLVRQVIWVDA